MMFNGSNDASTMAMVRSPIGDIRVATRIISSVHCASSFCKT